MRFKSEVYLFLDMAAAMRAGIEFGESENGVILTTGNAQGIVPLQFLSIVYATK
jgi:2'-phosphotransferase